MIVRHERTQGAIQQTQPPKAI